jgi:DUF2917 family protein
MRAESDSSLMTIARREFVELPDGSVGAVRCVAGLLWITEHGSSRDCVLGPGQSLALVGRRRVLIQGLRPSTLRLEPSAPRAVPARGVRHALVGWLDALDPLHHLGLRG